MGEPPIAVLSQHWRPGDSCTGEKRGQRRTSRRHMPMYSRSESVLPTSTSRLLGLIIFIFVTLRSTISMGRSNSPIMHSGMAPPHGCGMKTCNELQEQVAWYATIQVSALQEVVCPACVVSAGWLCWAQPQALARRRKRCVLYAADAGRQQRMLTEQTDCRFRRMAS